jgi:hypothetical protein
MPVSLRAIGTGTSGAAGFSVAAGGPAAAFAVGFETVPVFVAGFPRPRGAAPDVLTRARVTLGAAVSVEASVGVDGVVAEPASAVGEVGAPFGPSVVGSMVIRLSSSGVRPRVSAEGGQRTPHRVHHARRVSCARSEK